jgi:arginine/ornithine transport system permease protein
MRFDLVLANWDRFASGLLVTLELTALAVAIGFLIAVPAGLAIAEGGRGAGLLRAWSRFFRGTPLLVQTYLFYYGLAQFEFIRESPLWIVLREPWWVALIAFSLNSGAYATEIIRGAVAAIPKGQIEAARALGLTRFQTWRLVTIPVALRSALPQYGNEAVFMLHGSVVAGIITIQDLYGTANWFRAKYYSPYEGLLTAAVLYMAVTGLIVLAVRQLERRFLAYRRVSR